MRMTKYQIVEQLAKNKEVERLCSGMSANGSLIDDLCAEVYLILLEYNEEKIIKAYSEGWILFLIRNILCKQYYSSTSPFFVKYRKFSSLSTDNMRFAVEDDCQDCTNIKL